VKKVIIKRGDIFYADLRPVIGSEQGGIRPVLIIQNDVGIYSKKYAIVKDSVILLEQLRTIDKKRLKDKVCHLDNEILEKVDKALLISLELNT
jgi:mRNA interferase MazF